MTLIIPIDDISHPDYPIRPDHINPFRHFYLAFGKAEPEIVANVIVRLSHDLGGWKPFTEDQYKLYCQDHSYSNRWSLGWLIDSGQVVKGPDGLCRATHQMIIRCFWSSPYWLPDELNFRL